MQVSLRKYGFVTFALLSLALGILFNQSNQNDMANLSWALGAAVGLILSLSWLIRSLRSGALGSDALAVISIIATGATDEWLAASIISVMLATGRALEIWAQGRASSHLDALVSRAPHDAHVLHNNEYIDTPLTAIPVGTLVLVRAGEVVPLDGILQSESLFDESALSGEPEPIWRAKETAVQSGVVNAGSSVLLKTTTSAADSTYASLINLVASAKQQATQGVRLANKWAIRFVPIALGMALATWLISGDIKQAVAVIVAATPCPLILAVPVAIVSGISRASKVGVIIKTGSALEQLSRVEVVLIDKTGTLTEGGPRVTKSLWAEGVNEAEAISLAASLEQHSSNVVAKALVSAAKARALPFMEATNVVEIPGHGLTGLVGGKNITVGQPKLPLPTWADIKSNLVTEIQIDGVIVGYLGLSDPIRIEAKETIGQLFRLGVKRILLVSGDREETVVNVANELGITEHFSALTPEQKLAMLKDVKEQTTGTVAVVGDGINDAPALAAADIGIAMGARGATAASQSSDVVIIEDSIGRLSAAVSIAKSATRRALQASTIGMSLALVAMGAAAFGQLSPSQSAIVQELIDAAAIGFALVGSRTTERS
jgi:heavy metal translocating P-type ATPase